MKNLRWDRARQVRRVRSQLWHHLTPVAEADSSTRPDAAALLQLDEDDVRLLANLHFLLSEEVGALLRDLPRLVRRLATTTVAEEERSAERIRGPINWGKTYGARLGAGIPHLYVTTPARRAYQTPENELLVDVLDAIVESATRIGWAGQTGAGHEVHTRRDRAQESARRRALSELQRVPPTPRSVARIRGGRAKRRYASALAAFDKRQALVDHLERQAIKEAIEQRAFVTRSDPTLFEIIGTFELLDALQRDGWRLGRLRLFGEPRALHLKGARDRERLELWYQRVPPGLSKGSAYVRALHEHGFAARTVQPRRPDVVLLHTRANAEKRWIIGEVKLGTRRTVADSARAALADLLSYRRDFRVHLERQPGTYGLGLAWGAGLRPKDGNEIVLCTPDKVDEAVAILLPRT